MIRSLFGIDDELGTGWTDYYAYANTRMDAVISKGFVGLACRLRGYCATRRIALHTAFLQLIGS